MLKTVTCFEKEKGNIVWSEDVTYDSNIWSVISRKSDDSEVVFLKYNNTNNCVINIPEGMRHCYGTFSNVDVDTLDLSLFDTSNVVDMIGMFHGSKIVSLDLSSFDTSKVQDMSSMFSGCTKLVSLNISNFDTSNVISMKSMFSGCSSLDSLDVSSFDTSKVTDMSNMFSYCNKLVSLYLSNFNTSKVTTMEGMFALDTSLRLLDVSSFDTSNVEFYDRMFWYCSSLRLLDLSNFYIKSKNISAEFRSMFDDHTFLSKASTGFGKKNKVTVDANKSLEKGVIPLVNCKKSNYNNCNISYDVTVGNTFDYGESRFTIFKVDLYESDTKDTLRKYIDFDGSLYTIYVGEDIYGTSAYTYLVGEKTQFFNKSTVKDFKKLINKMGDSLCLDEGGNTKFVSDGDVIDDYSQDYIVEGVGCINRYPIVSYISLYDAKVLEKGNDHESYPDYLSNSCDVFCLEFRCFYLDHELFNKCYFNGSEFIETGKIHIFGDFYYPVDNTYFTDNGKNKFSKYRESMFKFFRNLLDYLSITYQSVPINKVTIYPNTNANISGFNLLYGAEADDGCESEIADSPFGLTLMTDEDPYLTDLINFVICMCE